MAFDLGRALMAFGPGVTSAGQAFDASRQTAYDRKRQQEEDAMRRRQNDLAVQKAIAELGMQQRETQREDEAIGAVKQFQGDLSQGQALLSRPQGQITPYKPEEAKRLQSIAGAPIKESSLQALGQYADVPVAKNFLSNVGPSRSSGVFGYKMEFDTPEYRQKNDAVIDILTSVGKLTEIDAMSLKNENKGAGVYDLARDLADISKTVTKAVRTAEETIPAKIETAGSTAAASTSARELTGRKIQRENPVLSEAQSNSMSDSYSAVQYLNKLKSAIEQGNADWFDINRKTGQFTNPKVQDAFSQLVEIVGRKRSGAAISNSEWENFGKEILNKNFLLTEQGKKQALEGLGHYLDKFYASGANVTGDEDWYNTYNTRAKTAKQKAEGANGGSNQNAAKSYLDEIRARRKALGK